MTPSPLFVINSSAKTSETLFFTAQLPALFRSYPSVLRLFPDFFRLYFTLRVTRFYPKYIFYFSVES